MKKIIASMSVMVLLAGCVEEGEDLTAEFTTVCVYGVEYLFATSGHQGFLSAKVDAETLSYIRCE